MELFKKILVGVDLSHAENPTVDELSPPTKCAIDRALWLAGQVSAELTFFSASDLPASSENLLQESGVQSIADKAQAVLEELVAQAQAEGIQAKATQAHGAAWEEIIRHVQKNETDLVIVGTRDSNFASRLLYGSTGIRLLRFCPCPVWVTKPDANWEDLEILVATDFSEVSQDALDIGVRAARLTGARLRVLHAVAHTTDRRMRHTGLRDDEIKTYYQSLRQEAEQQLQEQLAQTDYRTVEAGVIVDVQEGPADMVILNTIDEHHIDLLVMGTLARRGLAGMLIGNTAENLLPQLPCAILAIKPRDFECPVT
ncbi:MAG: universal stress protein [Planctomycetaceae bacterium]|nr:universal stress protein [Planctomycetaceae bacterium]